MKSPDEYIRGGRAKLEKDFQRFLDEMNQRDLSKTYISTAHAYLTMFFVVNGFKNAKQLDVERYTIPPRYRKKPEYIPTAKEAWEMVENAGSLKAKTAIACLFTCGLRNSTLRALRVKDLKKELEQGLEVIRIPVYREMKEVDPDACKGSIPYYSFISRDTSKILRRYLTENERKYGKVHGETPLFVGLLVDNKTTHMKSRTLQVIVHDAARKAGIERWLDVYPHCLRKSFKNVLKTEYPDGGRMDEKDQLFLSGHVLPGSEEAYYDSSKVEVLRNEYSRMRFRPETERQGKELKAELKRQILLAIMDKGEASKLSGSEIDDAEFQALLRRRLSGDKAEKVEIRDKKGSVKQVVVDAPSVESKINDGYLLVGWYPDGNKAILQPSEFT